MQMSEMQKTCFENPKQDAGCKKKIKKYSAEKNRDINGWR